MKQENSKAKTLALGGKKEEYLKQLFSILKSRNEIAIVDKKTHFNNTEIRMLGEIITARYANERLISAEIARRLGITRSAVSQMVNDLEKQGVLKRVPDATDRKIAYVELSEGILELYREDISKCMDFVSSVVEEFGEDNFNEMCRLFQSFTALVSEKIKNYKN